ncbi:MAG: DNA helicase UvrD [Candidatus Levybacteria bacterium]|nr:DNA helicase UvrD [Candidatus Levybacteria bacterium]
MQVVADLHLHSKYSRAVSQNMTLPTMVYYAVQKGIDLLTVSDWTHPLWQKEIGSQLEEAGEGIYQLKSEIRNPKHETASNAADANSNDQNSKSKTPPRFIFSTEISSIYTQGGKLRRIHNLVFVPSVTVAEKISKALVSRGANLNADGRPIIGMSAKDLLSLVLEIDDRSMLIPAHIWTPHFGIYGSASGFESLEEAFGDLASHIHGIETGLSSDPEMNWQIEELQTRSILSFSDAHSPAKMGRELTVFEMEEVSYEQLRRAVMGNEKWEMSRVVGSRDEGKRTHNPSSHPDTQPKTHPRILYTVEFYPEEGKYHFSGHRNCKVVFGPEEIRKQGSICPTCGKRLTEGVLYRLQQLADPIYLGRENTKENSVGLLWHTDTRGKFPPYVKLVPLLEIVAEAGDSTVFSQKTKNIFQKLIDECGTEIDVLLKTPIENVARSSGERVADGVQRVRHGNIVIDPGYDGEYGKIEIWKDGEEKENDATPQLTLDF